MRVDLRRQLGVASVGVCLLLSLAIVGAGCGTSSPSGSAAPASKFEVADDHDAPAAPRASAEPSRVVAEVPPAPALSSAAGQAPPASPSQPALAAGQASPAGRPQPPSIPGSALNAPASGTSAAELVKQMDRLEERILAVHAQMQQGEADLSALKEVLEAMLNVSTRVLASDADPDARRRAVEAKAGALIVLAQLSQDRSWSDEITTFGKSLLADPDPAVAIEGRVILLGLQIGEVSQGKSQDVAGLVSQVQSLLAQKARGQTAMEVAVQAAMALRQTNHDAESQDVLKLIAQAFQDHPDPRLAGESANLRQHLALIDVGLDNTFNDVVVNKEGSTAAFLDTLTNVLANPERGKLVLDKVSYYVLVLEQAGQHGLARQICEMVREAYRDHPDAEVQADALQWVDLTLRRLNLLDTPLVLAGTRLDGTPFDMSPYQGKLVIVAFWVASPSCQQELAGLKNLYQQYHDQGLEVIGVYVPTNLTTQPDMTAANQFVSQAQLPWTNITLGKDDWERFGMELVPYLLVVDRQGTIRELAARVQSLKPRLPDLLK